MGLLEYYSQPGFLLGSACSECPWSSWLGNPQVQSISALVDVWLVEYPPCSVVWVPKLLMTLEISLPTCRVVQLQPYWPFCHWPYRDRLPPQPNCVGVEVHPVVRRVRIPINGLGLYPAVSLGGCSSYVYNGSVPGQVYLSSREGLFPTISSKYPWPLWSV